MSFLSHTTPDSQRRDLEPTTGWKLSGSISFSSSKPHAESQVHFNLSPTFHWSLGSNLNFLDYFLIWITYRNIYYIPILNNTHTHTHSQFSAVVIYNCWLSCLSSTDISHCGSNQTDFPDYIGCSQSLWEPQVRTLAISLLQHSVCQYYVQRTKGHWTRNLIGSEPFCWVTLHIIQNSNSGFSLISFKLL